MKKIILFMMIFLTGCQNIEIDSDRELKVLDNSDSKELTFILELNTKNNSPEDVEEFTMYLADFIVTREPSTVYGYYISEDGNKVTLIERYNNSQDGIQHGIDFINGPNFDKFFEIFEIEKFITIGSATDEFKDFALTNGFDIEYRESIGGYVRR
ncbi:MAG: hypothetical protein CMC27_03375 [Flavobacteriaceae bacterium]|jgi:hypothetical protein|nr:hypothetical protein [Flavobacteriaceae bacterium]|tara:strand:+ start:2342 stop:2806 length:465 start_codon:yes stop_codon:yes gene_type:complete